MNSVCNLITDEERKIITNLKNNSKLKFDKTIAGDFFEQRGKYLDIIDDDLDLNKFMVKKPEYSFLIKVKGDSMINCGIDNADILLVDCSHEPKHGDVVVASINGKIVVKKLNYSYRETLLLSENDDYLPIKVRPGDKFEIWGVAIMVIKDKTL